MRRLPGPALAAALAAAAIGCGGEPAPPEAFSGRQLQTASCRDWHEASPQGRQAAIDRLESVVAGPHDDGRTLPDDVAYSTIEARCEPDFAQGFLLYELYIRAAAFGPPPE